MSIKQFAYTVTVATTALALLHACGDSAGAALDGLADTLEDAGADGAAELVRDAGEALSDGGTREARAQEDAGSAPNTPSVGRSGSRLEVRAQKVTGADGSELVGLPYLFDTELGARCEPTFWADGTSRCVPKFIELLFSNVPTTLNYYTDSACRTGRVARLNGCDAIRYLLVQAAPAEGTTCADDAYRTTWGPAFELGDRLAEGAPVYELAEDGTCTQLDLQSFQSQRYRRVTEVPASTFVELSRSEVTL